jgi:hypothetical protein
MLPPGGVTPGGRNGEKPTGGTPDAIGPLEVTVIVCRPPVRNPRRYSEAAH